MAKKKSQKIKPVKAWAGISDGKLHCWSGEPRYGTVRYYEIYPAKAQAKVAYEQYVPVLIKPLRVASRKG